MLLETQSGRDRPIEPFAAWQWAFFVLGTAGLSYGVGSVMYPGTGAPMSVIVAVCVFAPLMWHQQVGRAPLVVPQWITAAVGVAYWLLLEGMWKLFHAPRVHEAPAIVAVHLGLVGLAIASGVLGRIARRTAWLHPAPIRGR